MHVRPSPATTDIQTHAHTLSCEISPPCGERVHPGKAGQRGLVDGALAAAAHHHVRVAVLDKAVRVPDRVSTKLAQGREGSTKRTTNDQANKQRNLKTTKDSNTQSTRHTRTRAFVSKRSHPAVPLVHGKLERGAKRKPHAIFLLLIACCLSLSPLSSLSLSLSLSLRESGSAIHDSAPSADSLPPSLSLLYNKISLYIYLSAAPQFSPGRAGGGDGVVRSPQAVLDGHAPRRQVDQDPGFGLGSLSVVHPGAQIVWLGRGGRRGEGGGEARTLSNVGGRCWRADPFRCGHHVTAERPDGEGDSPRDEVWRDPAIASALQDAVAVPHVLQRALRRKDENTNGETSKKTVQSNTYMMMTEEQMTKNKRRQASTGIFQYSRVPEVVQGYTQPDGCTLFLGGIMRGGGLFFTPHLKDPMPGASPLLQVHVDSPTKQSHTTHSSHVAEQRRTEQKNPTDKKRPPSSPIPEPIATPALSLSLSVRALHPDMLRASLAACNAASSAGGIKRGWDN